MSRRGAGNTGKKAYISPSGPVTDGPGRSGEGRSIGRWIDDRDRLCLVLYRGVTWTFGDSRLASVFW